MDRQEYLNQISKSNQSVNKSKRSGVFASKFFWVAVVGVVALILIIIVGSALGGGKSSTKEKVFSLILHTKNVSEIVGEYQPNIKSSDLRSYSASLNSILSDTNSKITEYAENKYKYKEKDVKKSIAEEEAAAKDSLTNELFEAKINGNLDRVYAHKMAYEISLIATYEAQIIKSANDETLENILNTSYESLDNLYSKFNDFSEAN